MPKDRRLESKRRNDIVLLGSKDGWDRIPLRIIPTDHYVAPAKDYFRDNHDFVEFLELPLTAESINKVKALRPEILGSLKEVLDDFEDFYGKPHKHKKLFDELLEIA
ncbi:hypothetical protein [Neptuniibacter sp. QD37_11]|uniref:hypothetical protein n=1 Tax=Neptuniibacter sp. QD37_11 TaxID=3398209 RepID=UPI0039F5FFA1